MEKDDMDIFHLHKKHEHRIATRENYYKGILKKCWNRINMISSLHSYTTSCIFQIPDFVIGIPPHDMKDCSDFILNSLLLTKLTCNLATATQPKTILKCLGGGVEVWQ